MALDILGVGVDFGGIGTSLTKIFGKVFKSIGNSGKKTAIRWTKVFGKGMYKGVKALGGKAFLSVAQGLETATSAGLNIIGVFLQLADKLGILQPILSLIGSVFQMVGGSAMSVLAPALEKLATLLFSPQMMTLWDKLGIMIGTFVSMIIGFITTLLSDPDFLSVLKAFGKIISNVFTVITNVMGWLFGILGAMSPQQLGALFYALGIGIAFMVGLLSFGPLGPIMGAIFAGIAAIALAPLLFLAEGGYVPPSSSGTLAVIGEGGEGEYVIPESKMGGIAGNEEVVWATQDNGDKLDKIINILGLQRRLM